MVEMVEVVELLFWRKSEVQKIKYFISNKERKLRVSSARNLTRPYTQRAAKKPLKFAF